YKNSREPRSNKLLIANQILSMVDTIYQRENDRHDIRFWPDGDADKVLKKIEEDFSKLKIRWDRKKNCFTFPDGTYLPEPVQKNYRRHIWKLEVEGLDGESNIILQRLDKKTLQVSIERSDSTGAFTLNIIAVKNQDKSLAKLSS